MKFHDVTMVGPFVNEKLSSLQPYDTSTDQGRFVWLTDGTLWYGAIEDWVRIGNTFNVENMTYVNQQDSCVPNIGFVVLEAIRHDGFKWVAAIANNTDTCATHVVGNIIDNDNFIAVQSGRLEAPNHGLLVANYYFVSSSTPGNITSVEPSVISNPIIYVEDTNFVSVLPFRPVKYE